MTSTLHTEPAGRHFLLRPLRSPQRWALAVASTAALTALVRRSRDARGGRGEPSPRQRA